MPQVAETAHLSGGDIATKAQRLWVAMREEAVRRKTPQIMTKYGAGYYLLGTVQAYATMLFGANSTELRTIRAFLKASGNVVVIEQRRNAQGLNESKIFVRGAWNPAVAVPVGGGGSHRDRIDEIARRLTPEEAGETRPPAKVERRVVEPPKETPAPEAPVVKKRQRSVTSPYVGPVPETIELADGTLRCGACGFETSTTSSMGSHKRRHYHERQRAMGNKETTESRPVERTLTVGAPEEVKEALRRAVQLIDAAEENERAAEQFLSENIQLNETVQQLTADKVRLESDITRLQDENRRLVREIRDSLAEPKADPATAQRVSELEALIELIRGVVARYSRNEAGPVRTLVDVEDLLN